jgi:hypothetical protein
MSLTILKMDQLKLRDVVRMHFPHDDSPDTRAWSTCVVVAIRDGQVTLFRPYAITSEMGCGGKVIGYTGVESYQVAIDDSRMEYVLLERPKEAR